MTSSAMTVFQFASEAAAAVAAGVVALSLDCFACAAPATQPKKENKPMAMKLTSTAFEEGKPIPAKHTCEGADVSPPLKWSDAPQGTKGFALVCDDPDAPAGTWVHWV